MATYSTRTFNLKKECLQSSLIQSDILLFPTLMDKFIANLKRLNYDKNIHYKPLATSIVFHFSNIIITFTHIYIYSNAKL